MTELRASPPVNGYTIKKLGVLAVILGIIVSALTIMNQADIAEPHWLATRSFVRVQVQQAATPIERGQIQTQLFLAKSERKRIENELANKQVIVSQNPDMPQYARDIIAEQTRSLTIDLENTKGAIVDLEAQKKVLEQPPK